MADLTLDCTGLSYPDVCKIIEDLKQDGIETTSIGRGQISVAASSEQLPADLQKRILKKGDKTYADEYRQALKTES